MQRTLTTETIEKVGQRVLLEGWVERVRTHGKLVFLDLRDRKGLIQVVVNAQVSQEAFNVGTELKPEDAVGLVGIVNKRPERAINKEIKTGIVEIEAKEMKILSKAKTLPFDMTKKELKLELPTLFDHRSLTLKHPKQQEIFKVQEAIADAFREAAKKLDCTEIFIPTIAASATEGGAEVFRVNYYGFPAYLTQSPQLYKQIMAGVFERVYTIAHAYRAEPSVTTRHLTETVQMDCEIAFINSFDELLDALEFVGAYVISEAVKKYADAILSFAKELPLVPDQIPRLKMREAQEIIFKRTGRDVRSEKDLAPEDEKEIWLWAREEKKSDFVTVTHYPTKKRSFYTAPDPENPEYSLSYDLIFKGVEILSGSQRINDYDELVKEIKERGLNPADFSLYLQAFEYGMPPEGGFSFGLERITMKLLDLANVREASLFPRDMERVDERLSVIQEKQQRKEK
ncbi:aspartate--tRNA(Asn) ligase [Candidatus Parcubacteria bacterium]|nr:MAG: aspartate--tRNA(Asn) ligase [Candidatus Parcubacteria bacterium]